MSDDDTFEQTAQVGDDCTPIQASALRIGHYVVLNNNCPCKVVAMSTAKTGKHGHAKVSLTGIDIFTGRKYEDQTPSTHNLSQPIVNKIEYTLVDVKSDGYLELMDESAATRSDLMLPPDEALAQRIRAAFEGGEDTTVVVYKAMGTEQVMDIKTPTAGGGARG